MNAHLIQLSYFAAAVLFILSLRWLNSPKTARQGVLAGVAGMTAAIAGTLMATENTAEQVEFVPGHTVGRQHDPQQFEG